MAWFKDWRDIDSENVLDELQVMRLNSIFYWYRFYLLISLILFTVFEIILLVSVKNIYYLILTSSELFLLGVFHSRYLNKDATLKSFKVFFKIEE